MATGTSISNDASFTTLMLKGKRKLVFFVNDNRNFDMRLSSQHDMHRYGVTRKLLPSANVVKLYDSASML